MLVCFVAIHITGSAANMKQNVIFEFYKWSKLNVQTSASPFNANSRSHDIFLFSEVYKFEGYVYRLVPVTANDS